MPTITLGNTAWSDSGGATAGSLSCTAPTGIDGTKEQTLVIVCGSDDSQNGAELSINAGTYPGWTKHGEGGETGNVGAHVAIFTKAADGTEGTVVVDSASNDELWASYTVVDDTNEAAIQSGFGVDSASVWTISPGTLTSEGDDIWIILCGIGLDGGDLGTITVGGTGWSKIGQRESGTTGTDAMGVLASNAYSGTTPADPTFTTGGGNDGSALGWIAIPQSVNRVVLGTPAAIAFDGTNHDATVNRQRGVVGVTEAIAQAHGGFIGSETFTYLIDGSTEINDVNTAWTNDANAFDGVETTFADSTSNSADPLEGVGSEAPTTGDIIGRVEARALYRSTGLTNIGVHWGDSNVFVSSTGQWVFVDEDPKAWTTWEDVQSGWQNDGSDVTDPYSWADINGDISVQFDLFSSASLMEAYKAEVRVTTGTKTTGLFDGTVTDPQSVWTGDANANDGSTATFATCGTLGSHVNNELRISGTSLSSGPDGTILGVHVRCYVDHDEPGAATAQVEMRVYESDGTTVLSDRIDGAMNFGLDDDEGWSNRVLLDTHSGGWDWTKISNLVLSTWVASSGSGGEVGFAKAEIIVLTEALNQVDSIINRTSSVVGTTEVITVAGTDATVDRATGSVPRNVTGVTEAISAVGTGATVNRQRGANATPEAINVTEGAATVNAERNVVGAPETISLVANSAALNAARNVVAGTHEITFEISEGAVVNTTYVDGGTTVSDPLGDWINEAQAVDGLTGTGSTNVTSQLPGDIGPLELSGLAVVPSTTKALRVVKARIHGSATGINGTTYSVEVKIFSAGQLLDTITITDEVSAVWSTPQSTVTKPTGGWNWTKYGNLDFEVRALGTGGAPEPAVSINVIEMESTYGVGTPPIVNIPLVVTGTTAVNELTANLSDTNWNRVVSGAPEVITTASDPASLNRTRGVLGTTEVVSAVGTPAGVNARRVVGSTVSLTTFVENAASVNRTRGATAEPEAITLTESAATVDTPTSRIVEGATSVITATGNASTVNRTRGASAAPEAVTLTENASVITRNRVASALTEVVTLAENSAAINRTRAAIAASEVITVGSSGGTVSFGKNVAGATESIALSTNNANVNRTRGTAAVTEVVDVLANSAVVAANRGVISAVESLILAGNAAAILFSRTVSGATEAVEVTGTGATVDRGVSAPRNVTGITSVITATTNAANVNGRRVVGSTAELVALVENAAGLNMTRGVGSAIEAIQLSTNPASVVKERPVQAPTESIALATNSATVTRDRVVPGIAEAIILTEAAAGVFRGANLDITGVTAAALLSTNAASVSFGRNVVCATEQIDVLSNSAPVNLGRGVLGATESVLLAAAAAAITKTRTGAQPGSLLWAHPKLEEYILVDGRMIQL